MQLGVADPVTSQGSPWPSQKLVYKQCRVKDWLHPIQEYSGLIQQPKEIAPLSNHFGPGLVNYWEPPSLSRCLAQLLQSLGILAHLIKGLATVMMPAVQTYQGP